MLGEVPTSVTRAIWLLRVVVAWSGLTALLAVFFRDELIRSWAEGNPAAREILDKGGLEAVKESSLNIPDFVTVAIVLFVVFAAMAGVLVVFLRGGHGWARIVMSAMVLFMAFSTLVSLNQDLPPLFVVLSVVALLMSVVLLVCLWHKDTSAYLRAP